MRDNNRKPILGALGLGVALGMVVGCTDGKSAQPPGAERMSLAIPTGAASKYPYLADLDGDLGMTWLEPLPEGGRLRFSVLKGARGGVPRWETARTIVESDRMFVNWADFPMAMRDRRGNLFVHWLSRSGEGSYSYDVRLARSSDDGHTWEALGVLHDDGTQSEHGFVSMLPEGDGVRVFWLDGRETVHEEPMTLRTAIVGERIEASDLLDDSVCDCCQTDATMTAEGPIVVYRDRTSGEIRDIAIVRKTPDGWSSPASVHADGWEVPGCPVNGPAVAAGVGEDDRVVAVAWFTAAKNAPRVLVAFSDDAGRTFHPPMVVDEADPTGRVDIVVMPRAGERGPHAIVAWLARSQDPEKGIVTLRTVAPDGTMGSPLAIATTGRGRASGFPRMVASGEDLWLAWTDDASQRVQASAVSPSRLAGGPVRREASAGREPLAVTSIGSSAPVYTARTLEGSEVPVSPPPGGVVLVNFWATWCLPCREEIPILSRLSRDHADEGLEVIGVSLDDAASASALRRFVEEAEIDYRILHDPEDRASTLFDLPMLPATYLFGRDGRLLWGHLGALAEDDAGLGEAVHAALMTKAGG